MPNLEGDDMKISLEKPLKKMSKMELEMEIGLALRIVGQLQSELFNRFGIDKT
jgi:hypothetical protein